MSEIQTIQLDENIGNQTDTNIFEKLGADHKATDGCVEVCFFGKVCKGDPQSMLFKGQMLDAILDFTGGEITPEINDLINSYVNNEKSIEDLEDFVKSKQADKEPREQSAKSEIQEKLDNKFNLSPEDKVKLEEQKNIAFSEILASGTREGAIGNFNIQETSEGKIDLVDLKSRQGLLETFVEEDGEGMLSKAEYEQILQQLVTEHYIILEAHDSEGALIAYTVFEHDESTNVVSSWMVSVPRNIKTEAEPETNIEDPSPAGEDLPTPDPVAIQEFTPGALQTQNPDSRITKFWEEAKSADSRQEQAKQDPFLDTRPEVVSTLIVDDGDSDQAQENSIEYSKPTVSPTAEINQESKPNSGPYTPERANSFEDVQDATPQESDIVHSETNESVDLATPEHQNITESHREETTEKHADKTGENGHDFSIYIEETTEQNKATEKQSAEPRLSTENVFQVKSSNIVEALQRIHGVKEQDKPAETYTINETSPVEPSPEPQTQPDIDDKGEGEEPIVVATTEPRKGQELAKEATELSGISINVNVPEIKSKTEITEPETAIKTEATNTNTVNLETQVTPRARSLPVLKINRETGTTVLDSQIGISLIISEQQQTAIENNVFGKEITIHIEQDTALTEEEAPPQIGTILQTPETTSEGNIILPVKHEEIQDSPVSLTVLEAKKETATFTKSPKLSIITPSSESGAVEISTAEISASTTADTFQKRNSFIHIAKEEGVGKAMVIESLTMLQKALEALTELNKKPERHISHEQRGNGLNKYRPSASSIIELDTHRKPLGPKGATIDRKKMKLAA